MTVETVPYVLDLSLLGVIEGVSYTESDQPLAPSSTASGPSSTSNVQPPGPASRKVLCHYFGGIPYALPPVGPFRFKRPRALPPCYRYGTQANPGRFVGGAGVCPQPGNADEEEWEEDCLQLNVWVPAGEAPEGGWPVLVFLHGGFLQWGTPNHGSLTALLSETSINAIVVKPAYRLNVFGFLASHELLAESKNGDVKRGRSDLNLGFWDQRLALEWVYTKISYFGGDANQISLAGYSAGAHSAFHQLAHDLYRASKPILRRVLMLSNGPGVQPHSLDQRQVQFDELLQQLDIPAALGGVEKMARLRAAKAADLVNATDRMKLHEFRAVADDDFVAPDLFKRLDSGDFGHRMAQRGIELMLGECRDEHYMYATWRAPDTSSYSSSSSSSSSSPSSTAAHAVRERLTADYSDPAARALLDAHVPDGKSLPSGCADWEQAFGLIYADAQVHAPQRGLVDCLHRGGAGALVHRYRIEWRPRCADAYLPEDWGVTHTADLPIWFWGDGRGQGLEEGEKALVGTFVMDALTRFVRGQSIKQIWGTEGPSQVRTMKPDGKTVVEEDADWERGLSVWRALRAAGNPGTQKEKARM